MSYDFKERIQPISLKFKTNTIQKLFKDNNDKLLTMQDIEEIYELLAPTFEFLNANFEIIMSTLNEQIAIQVIQNIWQKFVIDAESMIVPSLNDDKERKQWEMKRFQFFYKYVEISREFFKGEGQGLNDDQILVGAYLQLQNIMNHYFDSKEQIMELYQQKEYQVEGIAYLKLLKMKGCTQFVEKALKNRSIVDHVDE